MTHTIDERFKDDAPRNTVNRIREALNKAGIVTTETWYESGVEKCKSVRVEIAGTHTGQNGKGVTDDLALASGYAEFMERLQSGYIYVGREDPELSGFGGFLYAPDEEEFTAEAFIEVYGNVLDPLWEKLLPGEGADKVLSLCRFMPTKGPFADFTALPFVSPEDGERLMIPVPMLKTVYFTNGTCAGNSREEALVQGMSEIMERHYTLRALDEGIALPDIPDAYLKRFSAYDILEGLRREDRFRVLVKDCSLGTGFPVVMVALIDRKTHGCIVKSGAHPVFEIALERTLTELFQGRRLTEAGNASVPVVTPTEAASAVNRHNVLKNASGGYALPFFTGESSVAFVPFPDRTAMNNRQLYDYCMALFREKGLRVYVRDWNCLGFRAYQIIVPGFSEIYTAARLREKHSQARAERTLRNMSGASEEDLRALLNYIRYKEGFSLENTISYTLGQPAVDDAAKDVGLFYDTGMCVALILKEWGIAAGFAARAEALRDGEEELYAAVKRAALRRGAGVSTKEVIKETELFFGPGTAGKLETLFDPERCGKQLTERCDAVISGPAYERIKAARMAVKAAMADQYNKR